jgi:hypothetical protein
MLHSCKKIVQDVSGVRVIADKHSFTTLHTAESRLDDVLTETAGL